MNIYLLLLTAVLALSLFLYLRFTPVAIWKAMLPAVFGAGVIMMISTLWLKGIGVITYDLSRFIGSDRSGMPYEIILSAFVFPFAGISIYNFFNFRYPAQTYEKYSLALSNILMGLCIAMIFFAYTKWYPVLTFALMFLALAIVEYKNKIRFMYRFYRAYLALLLFYIVVALPFHFGNHVNYNEQQTIKFRLIYLPFENYFLLFGIFLISILLFEVFKKRFKLV